MFRYDIVFRIDGFICFNASSAALRMYCITYLADIASKNLRFQSLAARYPQSM